MIRIFVYGIDQYLVGDYSKDHTDNLAALFETHCGEISFVAPSCMVFHEGAEQTSWDAFCIVYAPSKYEKLEKNVAEYLLKTLTLNSVHFSVYFQYFEEGNHHMQLNPSFPRYIEGEKKDPNAYDGSMYEVGEDPEHDHDDCDCDEHGHHHEELDYSDENQIYLGNAFEDFEKTMEERGKALATDDKDDKGGK